MISHSTVNHAYTALIAVNAILHPVWARRYAGNVPMKRLSIVFGELLLDYMYVWGCLLPMWMYAPYIRLDRSKTALEQFKAHRLGSIENSQREVEQIVVLSGVELLLSVLPFLRALVSLHGVNTLLANAKCIESWDDATEEKRIASLNPFAWARRWLTAIAPASAPRRNSTLATREGSKLTHYCHAILTGIGLAFASSGVFR